MKRLTLLVGLVLVLAGTLAGQAGAVDAAPAATERLPALDQAILARLNATRAAQGLRPLRLSQELQRAALFQSRSMLEGGFFAHESRNGTPFVQRVKRFYSAAGWRSWSAGENLLFNSAAISAHEAIEAWLGSPRHRELMLDPSWREVGIGSLHAASAGGMFGGEPAWVITMDFGAREGAVKAKRTAAVQAAKAKPTQKRPAVQKRTATQKPPSAKATPAKQTKLAAERPATPAPATWNRPDLTRSGTIADVDASAGVETADDEDDGDSSSGVDEDEEDPDEEDPDDEG